MSMTDARLKLLLLSYLFIVKIVNIGDVIYDLTTKTLFYILFKTYAFELILGDRLRFYYCLRGCVYNLRAYMSPK